MARGPGPRGQCWLGGQACGPLSLARGQLGTEWAARWHCGDVLGRLPAPARRLGPPVTRGGCSREVPPAVLIALPWHPQAGMVAAPAPGGTGPGPRLSGEAGQALGEPVLRGLEWPRGPRTEHSGRWGGEAGRLALGRPALWGFCSVAGSV